MKLVSLNSVCNVGSLCPRHRGSQDCLNGVLNVALHVLVWDLEGKGRSSG